MEPTLASLSAAVAVADTGAGAGAGAGGGTVLLVLLLLAAVVGAVVVVVVVAATILKQCDDYCRYVKTNREQTVVTDLHVLYIPAFCSWAQCLSNSAAISGVEVMVRAVEPD